MKCTPNSGVGPDDVPVIIDTKRRGQHCPWHFYSSDLFRRKEKPVAATRIPKLADDLTSVVDTESIRERRSGDVDGRDLAVRQQETMFSGSIK